MYFSQKQFWQYFLTILLYFLIFSCFYSFMYKIIISGLSCYHVGWGNFIKWLLPDGLIIVSFGTALAFSSYSFCSSSSLLSPFFFLSLNFIFSLTLSLFFSRLLFLSYILFLPSHSSVSFYLYAIIYIWEIL